MARESKLPYLASPGLIPKILGRIQEARRPERFTQDFLETKLGHSGGSARAMIPLLKRLGFISDNGTPTDRYDAFRNESSRGAAMAEGLREAYREVFDRNNYAGDLSKDKFQALVVEITGAEKDSRVVQLTASTFFALKEFADFDELEHREPLNRRTEASDQRDPSPLAVPHREGERAPQGGQQVGMNLSYTINLNLPETTNPDVFNAIFRALRENLLPQ